MQGIAGLVFLIAFVFFTRALLADRPLERLSDRVGTLGIWGPVLFGLLFMVATVVLLPATPIAITAGAVLGPVVGAVVISLASTTSAALSFLAGRYLGWRCLAGRVGRYRRFNAVYQALGRRGGWKIVAAVRFSHMAPFGFQSLVFGATPVRFVPFVLATVFTMLPGAILYCYLGHLGAVAVGAAEEGDPMGVGGWVVRVGGLLAVIAALLYVAHAARKAIRHEASTDPGSDLPGQLLLPEQPTPADEEAVAEGSVWGVLVMLSASLVLLAAAVWGYVERDHMRQFVGRWFF
jgi:uncharacterized membrane protein YdjX (TVP38/TMEM64 family)